VNAFDWEAEFPNIMKDGGFDVVIGNPPYGADFPEASKNYLKDRFRTFVWRGESYLAFVEKALAILKSKALFGYIVPDTYLNLGFTEQLRSHVLQNSRIKEIVVLPSDVFSRATVDTTLLFLEKAPYTDRFHDCQVSVRIFEKKREIRSVNLPGREFMIPSHVWYDQRTFNVQVDVEEAGLLARIEEKSQHLSVHAEMFYGIKAYQVGKGKPPQTRKILEEKPFTSSRKKDKSFFPFFDGKHIARYQLLWKNNNWLKYGLWLAEPRMPEKYQGEKILIRKIVGMTLIATYVPDTSYCNTLLFVLKKKKDVELNHKYLLGILNSRFIGWYFRKKFQINAEDTFPQIMIRDILQLPVHPINFTKPEEKKIHDELVALADKMLELHKQFSKASFDSEKEPIQRQITATDKKIDALVYELYGLTEEEIKIVEGKG
jgi:methylase of polypeptide subunit release factors